MNQYVPGATHGSVSHYCEYHSKYFTVDHTEFVEYLAKLSNNRAANNSRIINF